MRAPHMRVADARNPGSPAREILWANGAFTARIAVAILFLACAGCRTAAPERWRGAGDSPRLPISDAPEDLADLPGIGDAPDAAPQSQPIAVSDPLEPVNRAFFHFNDKLYFWVLKPISSGYRAVVAPAARRGVKNFFANIATPVRLVNCALQAEFRGAWVEVKRFAINTTVGVGGFGDPARNRWGLESRKADFGQTLGRYGVGPSIYFCWPIIGPSSARDTVGYVGDLFLDPINYLVPRFEYNAGIKSYDAVNATSLRAGEYEEFKNAAIDPYVALRDAYYQYRMRLVNKADETTVRPSCPLPAK